MDEGFERVLREAGLRVTRPRLAVLAAVQANPHGDTDTIFQAVRAVLPRVSRQSVYDGLRVLTDSGLVRRVQPPGLVARYDPRTGDNHHHLVCRRCGAVVDVDCSIGAAPCLTPSDDHGFQIEEAEVTYWGLCPDCASSRVPAERPLVVPHVHFEPTGRRE